LLYFHCREIPLAAIEALAYQGSEKLLTPVTAHILTPSSKVLPSESVSFIDKLVAAPNVPSTLVHRITSLLLTRIIQGKEKSNARQDERKLLRAVQQRYLEVFRRACDEFVQAAKEDEDDEGADVENEVEQLVVSLSLPSVSIKRRALTFLRRVC
jgi:hypothetical protein